MVIPKDWQTQDSQGNPLPVLSAEDFSLDKENSTAVVSSAYKFVIPVPPLGQQADQLVYPSGHPQAGKPIVDDQGNPVGQRGLIFFNDQDQAWQAVPDDGTGVIIINEVTPAQAAQLDEKVRSLADSLSQLTLNQLKEILTYSRTILNLGDIYNSTHDYVTHKLVIPSDPPAASAETRDDLSYGLRQRMSSDTYQAAYVPTAFAFAGVTTSAQIFAQGGVILEQQGQRRSIQPEVFMRTYRLASGAPVSDLAADIAHLEIETRLG